MQKPDEYLKESLEDAKFTLKLASCLLLIALLCLSRFIHFWVSDRTPEDYDLNEPWWGYALSMIGLLLLILAFKAFSSGWKDYRRYRKYYKAADAAQEVETEITDKFYFIKLLPGEDGPLEYRYFACDRQGLWRLSARASEYFAQLQPGCKVKAVMLQAGSLKEIADLEILHKTAAPEKLTPQQVQDKIASEVKVTEYAEDGVLVNKFHLAKKVRYYLIINKEVVEVNRATFLATPLYSVYSA
ncbi:hypothetical protein [Rufibacter roseus]|uniref:Uncharacterized protein n=1 Tax=Rufibacter roseus TaxID=1567108 RepID=A0ABW2DTS0_9BACT|nr:hypothetical protein [Rufibacter roseus]